MRKKLIGLAFLSLLTFGTYSCSNEIDVNEVPSQTDNKSARIVSEEIIPEVKEYYDNVKAIILSTQIYEKDVADYLTVNEEELPMLEKLNSIEIENEETGNLLNFWGLEDNEIKIDFITQYLDNEALNVSKKINNIEYLNAETRSGLVAEFRLQNEIMSPLLSDFRIYENVKLDPNESLLFYKNLNDRFRATITELVGEIDEEYLPKGDPKNLKKKFINANVQPGDILVSLPRHNKPHALVNFKNRFVVGHTAIITKNPSSVIDVDNDNFGIEAWNFDKVRKTFFYNWDTDNFYVMYMKKKRTTIKIRISFKKVSFTEVTFHDINRTSFVNYANSKIGRDYISLVQFPIMKLIAKNSDKYTCTTLIWKTIDITNDIKLNSWLSPIVTPSDIFISDETFVKTIIQ